MQKPEKKTKEPQSISDSDLIGIFLKGKFSKVQSFSLFMKKGVSGDLKLMFKIKGVDEEVASIGVVESAMSRKRILVLSPELGTSRMIRLIFGSFNHNDIFWKKGLRPLTLDQALEVNSRYTLKEDFDEQPITISN